MESEHELTVQWGNILRAAPWGAVVSLQLWKNKAIRPEFLVLRLEWKGVAANMFFFFFISSKKKLLLKVTF